MGFISTKEQLFNEYVRLFGTSKIIDTKYIYDIYNFSLNGTPVEEIEFIENNIIFWFNKEEEMKTDFFDIPFDELENFYWNIKFAMTELGWY